MWDCNFGTRFFQVFPIRQRHVDDFRSVVIWFYHIHWEKLVGGWPTPLKNMSSSVGMMKFPTEWKNKSHVPKHQPVCIDMCYLLVSYGIFHGISMVYSPPFKQHDAAVSWRLELEVFRVYVGWEDGHMPFVWWITVFGFILEITDMKYGRW